MPHARWSGHEEQADWAKVRREVLERDDHRCQLRYVVCTGVATEVDHKVPEYKRPNVTVTAAECQAVCPQCHAVKSRREQVESAKFHAARRHLPREQHPSKVV